MLKKSDGIDAKRYRAMRKLYTMPADEMEAILRDLPIAHDSTLDEFDRVADAIVIAVSLPPLTDAILKAGELAQEE